jgi:NTP pyrophosphatase (non-canonical NTP hydrolase)
MTFELSLFDISSLKNIQDKCFGQATAMGWHQSSTKNEAVCIALCHSELSEALEGFRKDLMDEHLPHRKMAEVELADCMIRIFNLAGSCGFDLAGAIAEKHAYNAVREDHKPENRRKVGGKKF